MNIEKILSDKTKDVKINILKLLLQFFEFWDKEYFNCVDKL
jgi:hypothetical protein